MLKKCLVLLVLAMLGIAGANASTWKIHSPYNTSKMHNIFDTGNKVYYLNDGNLFQFDKATLTTTAINRQNILSDNLVTEIFFDWEKNLLFVAYANSNIDIIDSLGHVSNFSGVRNMVSEIHNYTIVNDSVTGYTNKAIRDITFGKGKAYITYGQGFIVVDEESLLVDMSYKAKQTVTLNSVALMGDTLLVLTNNRCYYGAPGNADPIANYASYAGTFTDSRLYTINNQAAFVYAGSNGLYRLAFNGGSPSLTRLSTYVTLSVQKSPTGFIANYTGRSYSVFDETGTTGTSTTTPSVRGSSYPLGDGSVWVNDNYGLHMNGSTDYYKANAMTIDAPYWLKYNATLGKLYTGVSGPNIFIYTNAKVANVINTYDGVNWANATAYTAQGAGYEFVFDPLDAHTYVRTGWTSGIAKVTDDVKKTTYTTSNSLIGTYKPTPAFDKYGNLWVVTSFNAAANPCTVLPRAKYLKTTPAKTDWFQPTGMLHLNTGAMQRSKFIISSKNNVKMYSDCDYFKGSYNGHIICWDNGVEDPTVDNYSSVSIAHFVDQNNQQIDWTYLCHFEEDKNGDIWVGHTMGLFKFDPDEVFNPIPRATRPYVTKSDEGKGYLCEGYWVNDIGVDRDNNKWIASYNGLYYVSPDGTEVINHFTTDNSDLPSNTVYSVECDTIHDRVYIFTDNGFAEYFPNGDAGALDFNSVYAFPNPVNPDFTGMVKIAGLMENSYVTITDRNGNVVSQLGPVMGSAFWDANGTDGERVPTGTYNVYAAQGGQPAITGTPHATIMVIK